MNIIILKEKLIDIVNKKVNEQYPQIFIRPTTKDEKLYKTSCAGYKWYIDIMNDISKLDSQTYDISGYTFYKEDFTDAYRMLEDAENAKDIIIWCFLNIEHN
jgi:hypothetical protein